LIDVELLNARLARLGESLSVLRRLASIRREALLKDPVKLGAVKYYLLEAIQACLDMGNHIIASEAWEKPSRYSDVFGILANHDVIPAEFANNLTLMAGFRNRIVHLYMDLDSFTIHDILTNNLDDFDRFARCIHDHMTQG